MKLAPRHAVSNQSTKPAWAQVAAGDRRIMGLMLESHLVAGRQDLGLGKPLVYGQSVTDGCIDWPTTAVAFERLAGAVRERRRGVLRSCA